MKISLKGINFSELKFKLNNLPQQKTEFKITPNFKRTVVGNKTNDKTKLLNLICSIESSFSDPKPFDLVVSILGNFECEDDFYLKELEVKGTELLYPYLRSAISNLMTLANFPPINLPVLQDGILFPEDKVNIVTND